MKPWRLAAEAAPKGYAAGACLRRLQSVRQQGVCWHCLKPLKVASEYAAAGISRIALSLRRRKPNINLAIHTCSLADAELGEDAVEQVGGGRLAGNLA